VTAVLVIVAPKVAAHLREALAECGTSHGQGMQAVGWSVEVFQVFFSKLCASIIARMPAIRAGGAGAAAGAAVG
jgi:hypothetical protein